MSAEKPLSWIVPAGTQIVTLIEAKVYNDNRLQPRGAVGKIKLSPTDAKHSYVIEFADFSTASLKREQFALRKEFQTATATTALDELDLNQFVIYRCVVGSKAFGLDDEDSDTDRRGIYLPPARLHWSLSGVPEQLENKETEECYWELAKFLTLALKANPNILECLNTPLIEFADETARELLDIRRIFYSKLIYQTYNGYVLSQFKKIEQDLRNAGAMRPKHAMHLIRLLLQGIEILRSGELNVKVDEHREKLLAIKSGAMNWEEINVWRLELHQKFDAAHTATKLPERPDYELANKFLIKARRVMLDK